MERWIYFIQEGDDGPVKIGSTTEPAKRLSYLQVGNPTELHLIGAWPDTEPGEERDLHVFLAGERLRGEWFRPTRPVLEMAVAW